MKDQPRVDAEALGISAQLGVLQNQVDGLQHQHEELQSKSAEAFTKVAGMLSELKQRTESLEAATRHIYPGAGIGQAIPIIKPK